MRTSPLSRNALVLQTGNLPLSIRNSYAPTPRVALFVTCIVDQALPEVGVAAVRLLRKAGYEVDFPMSQTCCGQPFFNSGFRDEARTLAQRMIEIFEP